MGTETLEPPARDAAEEIPGFSNFDHEWDAGFEPVALVGRGAWCQHCAWGHWGLIWWQDGQFHEQVWRYNSVIAVVSRDSVQALVLAVNEEFGDE